MKNSTTKPEPRHSNDCTRSQDVMVQGGGRSFFCTECHTTSPTGETFSVSVADNQFR